MKKFLYNLATDEYKGPIAFIIKILLFSLSLIYGAIIRLLILLQQISPYRLDLKVISVGNITLGGTGKTSLVEFIARYLKEKGRKVAVLSRGYKRKITRIENQESSIETMGDEPYMLSKKLVNIPVIVDKNRIRGAKKANERFSVDTVILDDGFQQWGIEKDLEIVTIDATNPFGNRQMIPRGILREPLTFLKRADIFVLTKTNLNSDTTYIRNYLTSLNPKAAIFESMHSVVGFYKLGQDEQILSTNILKHKSATLLSGIGDPGSFEQLIKEIGIKVGLCFKFPDHYNYSKDDIEKIISDTLDNDIDIIITTEKDAVRLKQLFIANFRLPIFVLGIELKFKDDKEVFFDRLLRLYSV